MEALVKKSTRTGLGVVAFTLGAASGCGFFESAYVPGVDQPVEGGAGGEAEASSSAFPENEPELIPMSPPDARHSFCGDGLVSEAEDCDDGGLDGGDGCSAGCLVEPGFACGGDRDGRSYCEDIDECVTDSAACVENALCTNQPGAYGCSCAPGFQGAGFVGGLGCVDFDECAAGVDNCDDRAACTNTFGSFTCACLPGFVGDGTVCVDADECKDPSAAACSPDAKCVDMLGSYQCICRGGFVGDGLDCKDIDECDERTDQCSDNGICSNTRGYYTCACKAGYAGDGYACSDVDECALGIDECDEHSTCVNWEGGYSCDCFSGWEPSGRDCIDIDECATGEAGCSERAA
ncbi:MAG: hypothetical protein JNK04_08040, partial [Myxococcales bacterium]|nr:hypothetical protein [Myxococcales bacterium]